MEMEITRGTTPTLNFVLPFSSSVIQELKITFLQNGKIIFTKGLPDVSLEEIDVDTENGFVTDQESDDSFSSNDAHYEGSEVEEKTAYTNCKIHLTQEDTLGFTFWPAAEKNIAYSQIRILDTNGEAYASNPLNFRIFGVLLDGKIGANEDEEDT